MRVSAIAICAGAGACFFTAPLAVAAAFGTILAAAVLLYAFSAPRHWPLIFCASAILLPPFPVAIGESGAHASVLIAFAGLLGGIVHLRAWQIRRTSLNFCLVGLLGMFAISLGFAALYSGLNIAAASTARLIFLGAGMYVYFTASQGPGRVDPDTARTTARWLFGVAIAAALFGCIDFLYQLPAPPGFGAQFIWLDTGVYRRAQGLFYDASALGNFCAFFLVMSVAALITKRIMRRAWAGVGVVVFLTALLLSFSRAAVGAAFLACLVLVWWERKNWVTRRLVIAVAVLALITGLVFLIALPQFASVYWARLSYGSGSVATPERFFSGRLESWRVLADFIVSHPFQMLTGIGYKTLPYTNYLGRPIVTDNMYLSTLVETGLAGLGALLASSAAILHVSFRAAKRGSFFGKWMFCFWIGEMFQMMLGDVLTFWRVLPVVFWVLAQVTNEIATD